MLARDLLRGKKGGKRERERAKRGREAVALLFLAGGGEGIDNTLVC